jgi:hypothetical protein
MMLKKKARVTIVFMGLFSRLPWRRQVIETEPPGTSGIAERGAHRADSLSGCPGHGGWGLGDAFANAVAAQNAAAEMPAARLFFLFAEGPDLNRYEYKYSS